MIKISFLTILLSLGCIGCVSWLSPASSPPLEKPSIAPTTARLSSLAIPHKKTTLPLSLKLKQELDELTEKSQNRQEEVRKKIEKRQNQIKPSDERESSFLLANRFKSEKNRQVDFLENEQAIEQTKKIIDQKRKKLLVSQVCSHLEDKQRRQLALNNDQKQLAAECLLSKELNKLSLKPYNKTIIKERIKKEQKDIKQ